MRPIVEDTTDPHDCFLALPSAEEYPLWRIACRVCLSQKRIEEKYLTFYQVGLEEEAVVYLLQRATSKHRIRSAFTRGSFRGAIYVEGILDADTISLLNLTPGIRRQCGVVRQSVDPDDWVKLLTMKNSELEVEADQWVRVLKGSYKGDYGFVTRVEAWGAQVLVVPRFKLSTPQGDTSLKRKRTAIRPEPRLFDPDTFSSEFQRQPKLRYDGCYTSRGLVFDHGLLRLNLDLHSISIKSVKISSRILDLFKSSLHPAITNSKFPCPEEWIFEEGERVIVLSSGKEATIVAVTSTHLEVDLTTSEGIEAVFWYNVRKFFSAGDFVSVMSGPLIGTTGWVELIVDDTVTLHEYKEEGNVSRSIDDVKVSFILIPADIC